MTIPTPSELALLRTRPHSARMWLSIYRPPVIFSAQVTGSYGQGVNSIPYDSVVSGSYSNIVSGMTLLVGTTPQGRDVGKIRVRSATAAALTVAENADINWLDNLYLTVVDFHEPWPVFPRMTLADGNTVWYKDYDIPYSNQNSLLGSLINMGPNHAGFVGTGANGVYYSASGTQNLLGQSLQFAWQFPGGVPSWYSGSVPGYVSYPTGGFYTTTLTVTAANGVVEKGYRHISIYDRPNLGNKIPIMRWGLLSLDGSRSDGGWSARVWSRDDLASIVDGALCVIFVEADYGGVSQGVGGNAPNRSTVLFAGYISGETIHYDWEKSYAEFEIKSITGIMKEMECFSVALNSVQSPAYWYEMLDMDVRRAIYHYLKWQTTVSEIADIEFRNFTDQKIQYFDADKTSLYDAVNGIAQSALFGQAVSDRQGKIWFEQEAGIISNASGTIAQSMDLTRQDWMGEPYFSYQDHDRINYVELGGIAYSGVITGSFTALLAGAPGAYVPRYGGQAMSLSGLALVNQAQLNELAGDFLAWRGSRYSDVEFNLTGDYRNLDIAPQEQILLTLHPEDTVRGFNWNRRPFIIQRMSGAYNPKDQTLLWSTSVHELTKGIPGSTIEIPPVPPDEWPIYEFPPINLPGLPPFTFPPMPTDELTRAYVLGWGASAWVLARTDDFNSPSPTWVNRRPSNITGSTFGIFHVDPWDSNRSAYYLDSSALFYLTDLNTASPVATIIKTVAQMDAEMKVLWPDFNSIGMQNMKIGSGSPGQVVIAVSGGKTGLGYHAWIAYRASYTDTFHYTELNGALNNYGESYVLPALDIGRYNPNVIFVGTQNAVAGNVEFLEKSVDGGATFTICFSATGTANGVGQPSCVHLPREAYLNDGAVWVMGGYDKMDAYMQRSIDQGVQWADRTYISLHGYGDGGGYFRRQAEIKSFAENGRDVIALVRRSYGKRGYEAGHILSSMDNGITWTLKKTFNYGNSSHRIVAPRCLERHPYNSNRVYCVGNSTDGYILASADRGATWSEKKGNWFTAFGANPTVDSSDRHCMLYPIW